MSPREIPDEGGPLSVPVHLSYSQMNTLSDCGGRYFLEKVQKVPSRPGWANVGGSAVHRVTEDLDLLMLQGEYIADLDEITRRYTAAFEEQIEIEKVRSGGYEPAEFRASGRASKQWPDKEGPEWWLHHGPLHVKGWVGYRDACGWDIAMFDVMTEGGEIQERPAVELDIEFVVWLDEASWASDNPAPPMGKWLEGEDYVRVIGSIDRVLCQRDPDTGEMVYYIVDLKSGSRKPVGKAQLLTYRRGLLEKWGVDARWAGFYMTRDGQSTIPIDVGAIDLAVIDDGFRKKHQARMRGDFVYHESSLCVACGVNSYCPIFGGEFAGTIRQPWEISEPISLRLPSTDSNDGAITNNTPEEKSA